MKSIANQYRDLKEGRMSQANFMRNLRMTMPQFVTNTTSFKDAVRILKNKSILNENMDPKTEEEVFSQGAQDESNIAGLNKEEVGDEELDAILKGIEQEKTGEEAVMAQYDEELNEAKKKDEKIYHRHQCNPTELRLGIRTELEHGDMELDKAKEIAYKNIAKDPIYYTTLKLSGVEAHPKKVKGEKEVPVKKAKKEAIQLVDLVNSMQKVKMPKTDEKKKLKENVEEAMRFKDLPADPEKYKIVRDSKNYIIKATNADGVEFQKGDEVTTYDGEKIKIAKFEESQGKVKAIYNKGMFFASIDIDGLEAPKTTFRPGVNIGGSFEKMKRSLEEIVREVMAERPYGDNLIDPIAAEEENN
jgi:hypothetical protein